MDNNTQTLVKKDRSFGLSTFVLKLIAIIAMTFDHVGYMMQVYFTRADIRQVANIFRIVGRITYPLIIFCLIEGLMHTHDIKKYMMRLGIAAFILYIGFTLAQLIVNEEFGYEGNIFLSLFLCSLSYYILFYTKKKWLVILPILYFILSLALMIPFAYSYFLIKDVPAFHYLNGLYCQYSLLTPFLFFGILGGYKFYDYYLAKKLNNDELFNAFKNSKDYQRSKNAIASIIIALGSVICYLITYLSIYEGGFERINDCVTQTYMLIAALFILFYNGKRGYKSKITQYGFYFYYPLHMAIIYLIFWLMFGI